MTQTKHEDNNRICEFLSIFDFNLERHSARLASLAHAGRALIQVEGEHRQSAGGAGKRRCKADG
jgi:hypothetical protein